MSVGTVIRNIGIGTRYTGQFFIHVANFRSITNHGPQPDVLWSDETTVREAVIDLSTSLLGIGVVGAVLGMVAMAYGTLFLIPAVTLFLGLALSHLGEWIERQEETHDYQFSM